MFFIIKINLLHVCNSKGESTQAGFKFPQTLDSLTENKDFLLHVIKRY